MPAISTEDAALLRQFPQTVRRYLSAAPRETVFAARVSSGTIQRDGASGGVFAIPYDSVTAGAYTDVLEGMTLDIGTGAGAADVGKVRVRVGANAAQILIAETVETQPISAGQYLTVRNEFRPWVVKPRHFEDTTDSAYPTSFTEYHDYDLVYGGENSAIPPKANITAGGYTPVKPAGFVDAGQDYRTVTLSGANSITLATGAAMADWLWEIGDGTPGYTAQHTFADPVTTFDGQRSAETERSTQNFVVVVSYYPALGTKAIVSTDGATWGSETTLTSDHPYVYLSAGLAVSGKQAGVAYTAAASGSSFQGWRYSGGAWGAMSDPDISGTGLPGWIHIPFHDNDDSLVYYGASTTEPSDDRVYRARGTTRTEITPQADGENYTCRYPRSIDTCAVNHNRVVLVGFADRTGSTNGNAVFASRDGGERWAVIYRPIDTMGADYLSVRCAGDDEDVFYLFGGEGHIAYSADFGRTLKDKRGNLGEFGGIDTFVNLCGG